MRTIAILATGAALLALAACDKKSETAGGAAGENRTAEQVASEMKKISLQPGQWEVTQEVVDVSMDGAPQGMPAGMLDAMKGRKTVIKHCITPEQVEKPDADFLTAQKDSKCTYKGFRMSGGTVEGTVVCPNGRGGSSTVVMQGVYAPATYAMTMTMDTAGMGGPSAPDMAMHMKMKTTGKRIGECTPDTKG